MDHVSGTERFMEPSSCGCKSLCPLRYKALVQPGVGERRRSLPLDPQLGVGSRCSQVRGPVIFGEWDLVRDPAWCHYFFLYNISGPGGKGSVFSFSLLLPRCLV